MQEDSKQFEVVKGGRFDEQRPICVLLLDDREENLLVRGTHFAPEGLPDRKAANSIQDAESKLTEIDIAVLDYHLGSGKFGTEVAQTLREKRPEVPIITLSATIWNASLAALQTCTCSREAALWTTWCRPCVALRQSAGDIPWWSTRVTSTIRDHHGDGRRHGG